MLFGSKIVSCGIPKFFGLTLVSRFQLQRTNSDCLAVKVWSTRMS